MVAKCVCVVFLLWASLREGLSCEAQDVQEIADSLGKVEDWEGLASRLGVSSGDINTIKQNCAISITIAQCYRRELVKTYCYQRGGDPERVKEDIRHVLESGKSRGCPDEIYDKDNLYHSLLIGLIIALAIAVFAVLIHVWKKVERSLFPVYHYAKYQKSRYRKPLPNSSGVFIKLALVKKMNQKKNQAHDDKYTRLTLQGNIDQILQKEESIEMDDILKEVDEGNLVVVEGAPGIGKSTLAWELCRQWPTLESLKRFKLVVHLSLREKKVQSATVISDLFPCDDVRELSELVAKKVLEDFGKYVLFVCDGFDELPPEQPENPLVMKLITRDLLVNATVLLTSRPSATENLLVSKKRIEILGFTPTKVDEYVQKNAFEDTTKLASFKAFLTANPVVKEIMYNPFNCKMIVEECYESGKPVPRTQTQLCTRLTQGLLVRYLEEKKHPLASKLPDNLEDLQTHDSVLYQQLVKIGKLAFEGKQKNEMIFTDPEQLSDNLGLLVERKFVYIRRKTMAYNFFHVALQEYMSAFYFSQSPAASVEHNSTSMDVVWRFVAGLTKLKGIGWDWFKRAKRRGCKGRDKDENERKVEKDKYEYEVEENKYECEVENGVVTVGPFLLECLYEAQDVQSCVSVFGEHRVEFLQGFIHGGGLHALGYCISICDNKWNVHMQHIPRDGLEMLGHGMKSVKHGGGSIEKLNLRECGIDQRGFENLAECIPYSCSLTSLDISHNPGGDGSLVKLLEALRKHGKLQTLDMSNIAIGMDDVAALVGLLQKTSLKELTLFIPLDKDKVHDIIDSLKDNHSLERLWLSDQYHSQYFSESERQTLDPRVRF